MPTISPDQIAAAFSSSGESPAPAPAPVPAPAPAPSQAPVGLEHPADALAPDDIAGSFATSGAKPAPSRQVSALGGAIADMSASFQPKRADYNGYCERLTADTVKQATGSDILGGVNLRQNAIDVLHDAKAKGIGFAYQPGMQLQPGDIALSGRMGKGYGHSMIVGADGVVRSDLAPGVGQNKIDWVIRPDWAHLSAKADAGIDPDAIAAAFGTSSVQPSNSASTPSSIDASISPKNFLQSIGAPTSTNDFLANDLKQKFGVVPSANDLIAARQPSQSDDFLRKLTTPGVGFTQNKYQVEAAQPAYTDPIPAFSRPAEPAEFATNQVWTDPHKLLPAGAKSEPVPGMPGYTNYRFEDGSHVVIGPGLKSSSNYAVYRSVADAQAGRPVAGSSAHASVLGGNRTQFARPQIADDLSYETGPQFYSRLLNSGIEGSKQIADRASRAIGLSPQAREDVGGAVGLIGTAASFGPQTAANIAAAFESPTNEAGKPASIGDRFTGAGQAAADTVKGLISGPDSQHIIRAVSLLFQDDPNQAESFAGELGDLGRDVISHPLTTATMLALSHGEEGVLQARVKALQTVEDGLRNSARGAELAGDAQAASAALAKAEQLATARQFVLENAERQRAGALTLNPKTWLAQARSLPADVRNAAGPALSRASSIADAFAEASPSTAMARGRELVQADQNAPSFLGMSNGTPAEAVTRPADYAQRIAQAFQEAEPTPQREEAAPQVTEPTPQVSDHEAETVAPEWERPAVNEWHSSGGDRIRVDLEGYHLYPRGADRPSGTFDTLHEAQAAAPPVTVKNEPDNVTTSEPNVRSSEANVRSPEPNVTSSPAVDEEERTALERIASRRSQAPAEETMPAKEGERQPHAPAGIPEAEVPIPDYTRDHGIVPNFPVDELHVDPDRFQYKIGYGANGVASSSDLGEARKFNPQLAGLADVWKDPEDGKVYVVNGHNRRALAKRTGEPTMNVQFIDADTPAEARFVGAMKNIAEGQGTAFDAAKLFRETQLTPDDLQEYGISLKGQIAKHGMALANLSAQLFGSALRNEIPLERAVLIGSKLKDHADQAALVNLIDKRGKSKNLTNDQISELIDSVQNAPRHTSTTDSLFGADETTQNLAVERAGVAAHIRTTLAKDANALGAAARNADRITSVEGNAIEAGKTKAVADENKDAVEVFDRLKNSSGPVSDILNKAAARIAAGEKATHVYSDALKQYRAEAKEYTGRRGAEGSGAEHRVEPGVQPAREGTDGERQTAEQPGGSLFEEPGPGKSGGTGDKLKSIAQRAENDAQARIDARKAKGGPRLRNTANTGIGGAAQEYIDHATDYAIIGAAKIFRGAVDRAEWVRQMVSDFGEEIRPYLDNIWKLAKQRTEELAGKSASPVEQEPVGLEHPADAQLPSNNEASVETTGASSIPDASAPQPPIMADEAKPDNAASPAKEKKPARYAASINIDKLSTDELQDAYTERAKALGLDKQEPLGRDEVVQQARTLGLTFRGLAKLPVGWKPNTVHQAVWLQAVRDADDAAHTAEAAAKRNYKLRPTTGNKAALERAKSIADETFKRRSALSREWGQAGQILQTNSDPFVAAREGDIFRQVTKSTNFKQPRSIADRVNSANFGKTATHYTTSDTDAALARLQTRFQKFNDLSDCKA